jgi:hypothetical protein
VKKVEMAEILGEEIEELIKEGDIQAIKRIKADEHSIQSIQDLQVKSTNKGVSTDFLGSLAVSDDGSKAWGIHITEIMPGKCRLLMQNFETGKSLIYNYEHQNLTCALMVAKDLNLAITGGHDEKTVLHCLQTGKTLKVLTLGIQKIACFYRVESVIAVGGDQQVIFLDLNSEETMNMLSVEVDCLIFCMQLIIKKSSKEKQCPQHILFAGGSNSNKLTKIILPKQISSKSNWVSQI